jgi:hypothetical protein
MREMRQLYDLQVEDYSKHLLDRPPQPLDPLPSPPGGKGTPPPFLGFFLVTWYRFQQGRLRRHSAAAREDGARHAAERSARQEIQ